MLSAEGARLALSADAGRSRSLAAPVSRSRSREMETGLSLPLILREDRRVSASLAVFWFGESGTVAGAPFVHRSGTGARLGVRASAAGSGGFVAAGATLTATCWRDRIAGTPARSHLALGINPAGLWRLGADWAVSVQAAAQLADGPAPSRLRMAVAGPGGVRGYDPDSASGDSGHYLRLQVGRSTPVQAGADVLLRPYLFADTGRAYNRMAVGGHAAGPAIAAAGVGVSAQFGARGTGDVLLAVPLRDAPGTRRGRPVLHAGFGMRF